MLKIGARNIKPYSHVERRYYCTTCRHTFRADRGTFFDTLRTDRHVLLDAVAMLVERNSLRAISRIKHCKPHTVLHWLDLAGQHAAAVSQEFILLILSTVLIEGAWSPQPEAVCLRAPRSPSHALPGVDTTP